MDNKDVLIQFEALKEFIVSIGNSLNKRLDGIESKFINRLDSIDVRLNGLDVRLSRVEARLDKIEEDISLIAKWVPFRSPIPDFSTPLKK